jgi:hypothetical protein
MRVNKDEIADLLRARGQHDRAAHVQCALPRQVDIEADAGVLHQFDLNVAEVAEVSEASDGDGPLAGAGSS